MATMRPRTGVKRRKIELRTNLQEYLDAQTAAYRREAEDYE